MTTDERVLLARTREMIDRQVHSLTAIDVALTAAARDLSAGRTPIDLAGLLETIQAEVARTRRSSVSLELHLRNQG